MTRGSQARSPPPCPLPARGTLGPPGGACARPARGQRKPGRPCYYHKRQTLIGGGPAKRGRKPGPRPSPPGAGPASAQFKLRPASWRARARRPHPAARQEARACAQAAQRPHPFRRRSRPRPGARSRSAHAQQCPSPPAPPSAWPGPARPGRLCRARPAAHSRLGQRRTRPRDSAPGPVPGPGGERAHPVKRWPGSSERPHRGPRRSAASTPRPLQLGARHPRCDPRGPPS
ncbi:PREDICTED: basic proline-rich protein-like, partial [Chinchilla lanigera]|uniref:basic proline-rich protein-like n=1 Tax=Chinchilla lanigera TaxID=34839 RepID=UPI0006962D62